MQGWALAVQLQAFARQLVSLPCSLRRAADAGARRASAPTRDAGHGRGRPDGDLHALGPVHAVHPGLQRRRPARRSRCPSSRARTGCRWAFRSSGDPPARPPCWRWPRSLKRRTLGRARAPSPERRGSVLDLAGAEHGGHRRGRDAEPLGVGGSAAEIIGTSISSASSQVANARGPDTASSRRSARETIAVGTCSSGRLRSSERSTVRRSRCS